MTGKVKIGVIGLGMGRWHLNNYLRCRNAEVIALCDIDKGLLRSVAEACHIPHTFTEIEQCLALEDLDAVTVALPNHLHRPVTMAALDAGKHVLVEKPMAMNAMEAQRMVDAAARAQRILMMHFNYRFKPEFFFMKRHIESGALGGIYFGRTCYVRRRGMPRPGSWFAQKKLSGGGALVDIGVHCLDLALWLMDYPEVMEVHGAVYAKFGPEQAKKEGKIFDVDDLATGLIRFRNGATLLLEASWASNIGTNEVYTELYGTQGGFSNREGWKIFTEQNGAQLDCIPSGLPDVETPQQHFVSCIEEGKKPICPGEHGLMVQKILDGIYASSEQTIR